MENRPRHNHVHEIDGGNDQLGTHMILKSNRQDMPGALPEGKTTANFGMISQLDLKNIREHYPLLDPGFLAGLQSFAPFVLSTSLAPVINWVRSFWLSLDMHTFCVSFVQQYHISSSPV